MTECSDDCLCDPAECLNRGVSLNRGKKLNVDIDKRNVYGIDSHTHKLIKTVALVSSFRNEDLTMFYS